MVSSAWAPDYPWGWTEEQEAEAESLLERAWGTSDGVVEVVQSSVGSASIADDPVAQQWWAKLQRHAATPTGSCCARAHVVRNRRTRSPTPNPRADGILSRRFNRDEAAYTASKIPGAKLIEVLIPTPSRGWAIRAKCSMRYRNFWIASALNKRRLTVSFTVMFTDIVGS